MKIKVLAFCAFLLTLTPIKAAYEFYLKIDGIDGESVAKAYEKQIEVSSFSWGVSNPGTFASGGTTAGKASFQDIHFTKSVDLATPALMLHVASGKHVPKAIFTVVNNTERGVAVFYRVTLEDVLVSSVTNGGSAGSRPTETLSLNYAKITIEYLPQRADGTTGLPVTSGWDIKLNVAK